MSGEVKAIAKQLLIFSFLLGLFQLIVFMTGSFLATGKSLGSVITCQIYIHLTENLISLGLLFWVLLRISRRMEKVNFGKLLVSALLFAVISYHFWFLFKIIYFYSTHSGYTVPDLRKAGASDIRSLINNYGLNILPPLYTPHYYFLNGLKSLLFLRRPIPYIALIFNPIVLSLWVSGVVWLLTKKKNREFFKESTLDNG